MVCDEHFSRPIIVYIISVVTIIIILFLFNIVYALKCVNKYTIIFLFLRESYERYII